MGAWVTARGYGLQPGIGPHPFLCLCCPEVPAALSKRLGTQVIGWRGVPAPILSQRSRPWLDSHGEASNGNTTAVIMAAVCQARTHLPTNQAPTMCHLLF
jgi:hypothetical protein